jgi:hypothetical protein
VPAATFAYIGTRYHHLTFFSGWAGGTFLELGVAHSFGGAWNAGEQGIDRPGPRRDVLRMACVHCHVGSQFVASPEYTFTRLSTYGRTGSPRSAWLAWWEEAREVAHRRVGGNTASGSRQAP